MTSERRCYTTHRESSGLDAFCQTCPTAEAVTTLLEGLGFSLSFQMDAMRYPAYTQLPDLPAQYHYSDEYVMYHQKSTPLTPLERLPPVRGPQCSTEVKAKRARPCHSHPLLRGLDSLCSVKR
jgi:hypothetical protein